MEYKPRKVDITLPRVLTEGYVMERKASIPGPKASSAHIHIPKKLAGNYIVILIPKESEADFEDTLQ